MSDALDDSSVALPEPAAAAAATTTSEAVDDTAPLPPASAAETVESEYPIPAATADSGVSELPSELPTSPEGPSSLPVPSGLHVRTSSSTSSIDSSSDDDTMSSCRSQSSAAAADINKHVPPLSVKDKMNFWRLSEKSPQHHHSVSMPPAEAALVEDGSAERREVRQSVRDAFLHRLRQAQALKAEEERRRHDETYRSEMQTAKEGKHKAQESLQLKITVDSSHTQPHTPSAAASAAAAAPGSAPTSSFPAPAPSRPPPPPPRWRSQSPVPFELDSASFSVSPLLSPSPPPRPPPTLLSHTGLNPHAGSTPSAVPDAQRQRSATSPGPSTPSHSPSLSMSSSPPSSSPPAAPQFPAGTDNPAHRSQIVAEIISSEQSYVSSLSTLISSYLQPLRQPPYSDSLTAADLNAMFGGVELLHQFHCIFLADLRASNGQVAAVILRLCDYLKMYSAYLQNYPTALTTIECAQRKNKAFQSFLATQRTQSGTMQLMSFLIMPVQRVPRYELLLRELMRYTPQTHPERDTLCAALSKMQSIAQHINDSQRVVEEMSKLVDVAARISGEYGTLLLPHRRLVKEGSVLKMKGDGRGRRRLYVFNDLIIWTSDAGKFRGHARVDGMSVHGWKDAKGRVGFAVSAEAEDGGAARELVFVCGSDKESEAWRESISEQCEKARERKRSNVLRQSFDLSAAAHRTQPSVSVTSASGARPNGSSSPTSPTAAAERSHSFVNRRVVRTGRGSGRETHATLMKSLEELQLRAAGEVSKVKSSAGDDEEKECSGSEDAASTAELSRVRRRGTGDSVSASPVAAGSDDD